MHILDSTARSLLNFNLNKISPILKKFAQKYTFQLHACMNT